MFLMCIGPRYLFVFLLKDADAFVDSVDAKIM